MTGKVKNVTNINFDLLHQFTVLLIQNTKMCQDFSKFNKSRIDNSPVRLMKVVVFYCECITGSLSQQLTILPGHLFIMLPSSLSMQKLHRKCSSYCDKNVIVA